MFWIILGLLMLIVAWFWDLKRKRERKATREAYRMREIIDRARAQLPAEPAESAVAQSFWRTRYALEDEYWNAKARGNGTHRDRKQMLRDQRTEGRNGS